MGGRLPLRLGQATVNLGVHIQGRLAACPAPRVARFEELAQLSLARVGRRLAVEGQPAAPDVVVSAARGAREPDGDQRRERHDDHDHDQQRVLHRYAICQRMVVDDASARYPCRKELTDQSICRFGKEQTVVDFTLTDEQIALREMAHDFAVKEIRPVAWEYDRDGTWPQAILEKAWELGLMNSHIPEEYGGPGVSYLEGTLIEEELSWGCSGIATAIGANGLATAPLALAGSHELKKKYLGMLAEAPLFASFCLTEPDAGSDVSGMRTTAVRKGDKYVINGSKCFITNG